MEHLVVGLGDLQSQKYWVGLSKAKNITAEIVLFLSSFAAAHLNVIHGEEKSVLHPPVFARLGPVWNNVDFWTKRNNLEMFYLLRTFFFAELCTRVF